MGLTYRRIGMGAKYGRYTHSECSCLGVRCYNNILEIDINLIR
jgi:hypothetical protein